jgi:hypothetical protein
VNLSELTDELLRLSRLIDSGLTALRDQAVEYSTAEHDYRMARAQAWVQAPDGTVPEREAWVDGHTAPQRKRRDLAEHMRQAALEAVRSRRGQLSAIQTLANAHRAEAEFVRTSV